MALQQPFGEEMARLVDKVSRALHDAQDSDSAVRVAVRCPVPRLADLAVLLFVADGQAERLEVAHADPEREASARGMILSAHDAIRRAVARDVKAGTYFRWISSITPTSARSLTRNDPQLMELLTNLGVQSLMVVALRTGGRLLGALALGRTSHMRYHAADLAVTQIIARRAAVALDRVQLHERKSRLEEALRKWVQVFDLAAWGAAIVDGNDGRIEVANPAFARAHGYTDPSTLIGRLFSDLLPTDRGEEVERWSIESTPEAYESVHVRTDGTSFPVLTTLTALRTGTELSSYVVTIQDMSELKRSEERLRRAQRLEAVGRLAGGVAHEVNNMMTIILGFGDLLAAATDLPPHRSREVEEIRKAALRTARVTQQLLAFSRQQILQPADLQLEEVVAEMASVLAHLLPANIRVETALAPVPSIVRVDRAQLDQVLINLAFNARDAMPLGGTLRIETGLRHFEAEDGRRLIGVEIEPGEYACLKVSDTGHGMDAATMAQVFEPFLTTKPAGTGTGLGLATVYGIVKQSGGFIWVESNPGSGTWFTACLPKVAQMALDPGTEEPGETAEAPAVGTTVLLVEDEEGVRELARRVLEEGGYTVLQARTGADLAAALGDEASPIDLVLSDVVVPDMTTVELERRIGELRPDLPILYMSGYSRDEVVGRGLVPANRPFIQKPFAAADLTEEVSRQLQRASAGSRPLTT